MEKGSDTHRWNGIGLAVLLIIVLVAVIFLVELVQQVLISRGGQKRARQLRDQTSTLFSATSTSSPPQQNE